MSLSSGGAVLAQGSLDTSRSPPVYSFDHFTVTGTKPEVSAKSREDIIHRNSNVPFKHSEDIPTDEHKKMWSPFSGVRRMQGRLTLRRAHTSQDADSTARPPNSACTNGITSTSTRQQLKLALQEKFKGVYQGYLIRSQHLPTQKTEKDSHLEDSGPLPCSSRSGIGVTMLGATRPEGGVAVNHPRSPCNSIGQFDDAVDSKSGREPSMLLLAKKESKGAGMGMGMGMGMGIGMEAKKVRTNMERFKAKVSVLGRNKHERQLHELEMVKRALEATKLRSGVQPESGLSARSHVPSPATESTQSISAQAAVSARGEARDPPLTPAPFCSLLGDTFGIEHGRVRAVAREQARSQLRVNVLYPTLIDSEIAQAERKTKLYVLRIPCIGLRTQRLRSMWDSTRRRGPTSLRCIDASCSNRSWRNARIRLRQSCNRRKSIGWRHNVRPLLTSPKWNNATPRRAQPPPQKNDSFRLAWKNARRTRFVSPIAA